MIGLEDAAALRDRAERIARADLPINLAEIPQLSATTRGTPTSSPVCNCAIASRKEQPNRRAHMGILAWIVVSRADSRRPG